MAKIGIVIPTPCDDWNLKLLTKCLTSLIKYKDPKHEYKPCISANNWDGFSIPVNKGLKQVQDCDYVLICNDDVEIIGSGWEDIMINALQAEDIGIVGHYLSAQHGKYSAMWFTMIKKEVFDNIGFLNEELHTFSQDILFGLKAATAGYSTAFVDIPLRHAWSQTTKRLPNEEKEKQDAKETFKKITGLEHDSV